MTLQTCPDLDVAVPRQGAAARVRTVGWFLLLGLIAIFALLQNPFWVRAGDSEVYLVLARSLIQGHGLRFNAQPVGLVPPGWPLLLAGMMKVSPVFAVLKLEQLLMVAVGLWLYFFTLQQLVPTRWAVGSILLTALLPAHFRLTYQFLGEGMFCVISGLAMLLALRINRQNAGVWSIAALALLCVLGLTARWTMVLFWPILAALLLRGELWPRVNARWAAAFISGALTLVCFIGLRHYLRVDPTKLDPRFDASLSTEYSIVTGTATDDTFVSRVQDTDRWLQVLLWLPWTQSVWTRVVSIVLLLVFTLAAVASARKREWVWLGVLVYYLLLCVNWPQPVARYLVPVTPLLLAGFFLGFSRLFAPLPPAAGLWTTRALIAATVLLVLVPNFVLYGSDVCDMQDDRFYNRYGNGTDQSLTQAARLISDWQLHSGDVVISRARATHTAYSFTNGWMRGLHFLCDIAVRSLPDDLGPEPNDAVARWMAANHVSVYLYQPAQPGDTKLHWTFWRDATAKHLDTEWHMYRLRKGKFLRIRLKDDHLIWPASVPGL